MLKCELCGIKFDESEIFQCERCGKKCCCDCAGEECCYNVELCRECDDIFVAWWGEFITGGGD